MSITPPKQLYSRIILLLVIMMTGGLTKVYAQCTNQCPVIANVEINSCVGVITLGVTGDGPFAYEWKDSGGNVVGNSFILPGLVPDDYTIKITDVDGDVVTATYTVTNPPNLIGSVVVNDVTCRGDADAQVIVTMANGSPDYEWELFNGGGNSIRTGTAPPFSNIIILNGLGVDNYTLSVTDDNGCTGDITFSVTQPADFLGFSLGASTDATCFNSSDGTLTITGTGGWGDYVYQWQRVSDGIVVGNTSTVIGLAPGDYRLVITDRNGTGCTLTTPIQTIGSPPEIVPSATINDALCNGASNGSIDLSVIGGVGPYTYSWSNGATTQDISGLTAGNYTVTITDNSGCTDVSSYSVGEPAVLTINPNIRDVNCFGDNTGRIRSNVTGGTAPYTYSWSTGNTGANLNNRVAGTYSLTVTDANGCSVTQNNMTISQPAMALSKLSEAKTNPSCAGGNDGAVTINMQGGTGPYAYSWSNGDTGATASALTAGMHTVTVTDNNGCTYSETFTLTDPIAIAVAPSLTLPSCNGAADGAISVVASNGTAPYVYNWNTGDSGPTINGLVAGTYTVTVTDQNGAGCTVVETITLGEPAVLNDNATVNNISCNGAGDGSIFLAVTGGTGPYTYLWNTGATTNNITGLNAGNFSVTITDNNGCTLNRNYTISDPAVIGVTYTQQDILCKGASTGSVDISPSGGTSPYTYLWSNGSTAQDLINVAAGNYSVTIKDASNCSLVLNVTLTEPATVMNLSGTETDGTCAGSNNGSIDLSVTGGSAPFSFLWNTGATTEDISGLAPGNYSVSVTDAVGCIKSIGFTITEPSPISISETLTDVTCNGAADGTISLNVGGGNGPYTYSWADDVSINTKDRTNLGPGNYTLTVTDASGCMQVETFSIAEPAILSSTATQLNVSCFGESTGSINLSVSGGTTPYTFSWSNGAITEDLTNIPAGNFSVTITDAKGCTDVQNFTISQPPSALAVASSVNQITCNGAADGIINLSVSGGSAPYSFNWSNGSTSEDLNSLPAGNFNVTVTDNNGCTYFESFTITDPPVLTLNGVSSDIDCNAADNGSIDITVGGGEGPYTFAWSNGETTEDVGNLSPGTYTVNVTDSRGCSISGNYVISQPTALALTYTSSNVSCFGNSDGSIDISVSGGTSPYSFSWSNGAIVEDINNLNAGSYTVTVTDLNGCTLNQTIVITEPSSVLSTTASVKDISCFGGSDGNIQLNATGGTAPYTYLWNSGATTKDVFGLAEGTYQVTITDFNGCSIQENYTIAMPAALLASGTQTNISCHGDASGAIEMNVSGGTLPYSYTWSNGATTEDLTGIVAGNYQVTITDASGCSLVRNFSVTQPLALLVSENVQDVACFGQSDGFIDLSVSGGIAPYTYAWSNGATTQDLFNISGGNYSVDITDGNGCITTRNFVINEPTSALVVSGVVTDELCFGDSQGAIDLTVSGGSAPYNYSWNHGPGNQDVFGLGQGVYQVTVTDNNGCSVISDFTVSGPSAINITASKTNISCNGANDGSIDVEVSGGTSPYVFAWNNGETSEDLTGLSPGTYVLTVTDANGCTSGATWSISQPLPLTINYQKTDVTCFGADDGVIDLTVSGGNLPYSYSWSNGANTKTINSLAGGTYEVTVTDAKGCQEVKQIVIVAPTAPLSASPSISDALCNGQPTGKIQLAVNGGTAPFNYSWSNGSNQRDLINVFAGNYSVTITDAKGCTITENYTIGQPDELDVTFDVTNSSCLGDTDGAVSVTPTGGTVPFSYVWSNGSTSKDLVNIAGGTYNLTITDANNCSITRSVEVGDSKDLNVGIQKFDVLCKGESTGRIFLDITGGSGDYSVSWSNGSTTEDLFDLSAGVYSATITDSNNCGTSITVVIAEPSEVLSVQLTDYADLLCYGDNSGYIKANPKGGVAPFTYLWSNGARTNSISNLKAGLYTVTVTDANGCIVQAQAAIGQPDKPITITAQGKLNLSCKGEKDGRIVIDVVGGTGLYEIIWSTGATTSSIENLGVGDYTVRVKDANGCIEERIFAITEPEELTLDALINESQCYDDRNGSIELNIKGGVEPYSYQWSTGATTKNLIGISSGIYSVRITDANGCQVQGNYTLAEPALFKIEPEMQEISCIGANDASISLNIEGGIEPIAISWSNGASTETITGLGPGQYNVLVTDDKGCTIQQTFNIVEPLALTLDAYIEEASRCNDPRSGRVNVIVSGGSEPYTYRWSNGATTSEIVDVLPGTYVVTVKDKYNCEVQGTYTVLQPEPLQIGLSTEPYIDCDNRIVGMLVKANVKGGIGNYSYKWSKGTSINSELLMTEPGRLTIEVFDDRGCYQQNSISVEVPELGLADFNYKAESIDRTGDLSANDPVSFFDQSEGEIIDWHWDFGDGFDSNEIDPIHTYDAPGTYTVRLVVTDRTGCQTEKISVLEITEGYRIIIPNAFTPNGDGNNDFFRPRMLGLIKAQLIIYNTWGEVIFNSEDIDTKGWDGMIKGQKAENGNYVYKIIGLSFNGLQVEREGIFALIN